MSSQIVITVDDFEKNTISSAQYVPEWNICVSGSFNGERICTSGNYKLINSVAIPSTRPVINADYTCYLIPKNPIFTEY